MQKKYNQFLYEYYVLFYVTNISYEFQYDSFIKQEKKPHCGLINKGLLPIFDWLRYRQRHRPLF